MESARSGSFLSRAGSRGKEAPAIMFRGASLFALLVLLPPFLGTKAEGQTSEPSTLQALRISRPGR